jgi:hypothetical protein
MFLEELPARRKCVEAEVSAVQDSGVRISEVTPKEANTLLIMEHIGEGNGRDAFGIQPLPDIA